MSCTFFYYIKSLKCNYEYILTFFKLITAVAALLLAPAVLQAALPSTPLNDEFTTSSNETVPASWWWKLDIGATGTWNIVGDLAQVNWGYSGGQSKILTGSGTINIGSETESGSLYIMGSNPPSVDNWVSIVSFNGTVNVGKMGRLLLEGRIYPGGEKYRILTT